MDSIAHIQVLPKLSGAQIFSLNILKNIDVKSKYLICSGSEKVTDSQKEDFVREFERAGVTVIWMKHLKRNIGFHDFLVLFEFWTLFRKYKFDVVHSNSTKPGIFARVMARICGVKKVVHTVHGIAFHPSENIFKKILYYILEVIALQFGHVNVTVNKFYLKFYNPYFWKKSVCIYNGLDFIKINNDQFPDLTEEKDIKRVLFVGRLDYQKNPLTAIKAFNILRQKIDNVHFDIVGDGELKVECEKLVHSLGLEKWVTFHGWVNEPYKFYSQCNVFFCPSLYEAFGYTFAEAAYLSKPIVASNVEGIPEVVIDGKMGFTCKPNDYHKQAECLDVILTNEKMANDFGGYGKLFVQQQFPLGKCLESYMEIYK